MSLEKASYRLVEGLFGETGPWRVGDTSNREEARTMHEVRYQAPMIASGSRRGSKITGPNGRRSVTNIRHNPQLLIAFVMQIADQLEENLRAHSGFSDIIPGPNSDNRRHSSASFPVCFRGSRPSRACDYRLIPMKKLKFWMSSVSARATGNARSKASGAGPNAGIAIRKPTPGATR